jgi:hypothetical protein
LRDAKKHGWFPSVTTIMKVLASPELDRWKQQQVLLASMTLPRNPDESEENYCSRIMEDAFKQVEEAADLGTSIHKALENHFQGLPYAPEMDVYVAPVKEWALKHRVTFVKHELRLVNQEVGYAGTTDALIWADGLLHVLDYHGQRNRCRLRRMPKSWRLPVELTYTYQPPSRAELARLGMMRKQSTLNTRRLNMLLPIGSTQTTTNHQQTNEPTTRNRTG